MDAIPIDSAPCPANVPFANETQVQRFVEAHAKQILGVDVIASTERGRRRLFDIDILAIDPANRPVTIECKWDLVGESALHQLARYKAALLAGWDSFEARVSELRGIGVRVEKTEPIQIAIGYRCDPSIIGGHLLSVICLCYVYNNLELHGEVLEKRRPGKVSIHRVGDVPSPNSPHPKVSKKDATDRRLASMPMSVQQAFWSIDSKLKALGVAVTYGGKNFVRYRVRNALFAEAVIIAHSIQWRVTPSTQPIVEMRSAGDEDKVYLVLRAAYDDALA